MNTEKGRRVEVRRLGEQSMLNLAMLEGRLALLQWIVHEKPSA